jgi:hypothetical protein
MWKFLARWTDDKWWQVTTFEFSFSPGDLSWQCDDWWSPVDNPVNPWWKPVDDPDINSLDLLTALMTTGDYLVTTQNDDTDDPCHDTELRWCLLKIDIIFGLSSPPIKINGFEWIQWVRFVHLTFAKIGSGGCAHLALVCDPVTTCHMLYLDSGSIQQWSYL